MRNKIKVIVALVCALAIAATGTFAWGQIMSEKNEFMGRRKGSHLHDDFDPGTGKKDVYVENTGNTTLYVRVKLEETMSIGSYTWRPENASHWVTHTHEGGSPENCGNVNHQTRAFHNYFTWTMGGSKWYLPASAAGAGEYIKGNVMQDVNEYTSSTPGARQTPNASIITAAEFVAMSETGQKAFIGWIYSTDGYAYWSQPLAPDEATGLLLHHVAVNVANESYYYAINVIAEVVDRNDAKQMWIKGGESVDGSPKQAQESSDDGIETIWIIIGPDGEDNGSQKGVTINGGNKTVTVGEKFELTYTVTPAGYDSDKEVTWSIVNTAAVDFDDDADKDNCFVGVAPGVSTITLTIGEGDEAITATITVTVTDVTGPTGTPTGTPTPTPATELPVNPGPFTPIFNDNPDIGDGYYGIFNFLYQDQSMWIHNGAIHLEDIITDGNYAGVTVSAPSKYAAFITIGTCHGKPSVVYSYEPTEAEYLAWRSANGNDDIVIEVSVTLTRGDQTATVKINMTYWGCLVTYS